MKSFKLISDDGYDRLYVSLKHNLKVVKSGYSARIYNNSTGNIMAELINASDEMVNKFIKKITLEDF